MSVSALRFPRTKTRLPLLNEKREERPASRIPGPQHTEIRNTMSGPTSTARKPSLLRLVAGSQHRHTIE